MLHGFVSLGFFSLSLSVLLGALGAHALKQLLQPNLWQTFHTGITYHQLSAIWIILLGIIISKTTFGLPAQPFLQLQRQLKRAGWCLLVGQILFSGNCYIYALTEIKFFVHLVPVGGICMIVGLLMSAVVLWPKN